VFGIFGDKLETKWICSLSIMIWIFVLSTIFSQEK